MRFSLALALISLSLVAALPARANPRPLPFTYQHEQLAAGSTEIEQFVDFTPGRAQDATSGKLAWYGVTAFTTEFETGLTDALELGLYVTLAPAAANGFVNTPSAVDGNGMKQRLRYSLAAPGEWPLDVSLYGELAENEHEFEIEGKILLQRRLGIARIVANLSAEHEIYFQGDDRDFVLNPSAGVTFEPSPIVQPGLETWIRAEYPEEKAPHPRPFELGPHVYVGPTLLLQFSRLWWSNGFYLRATDRRHTLEAGEGFGNVWFRTVIGIGI
jgi:hypothetical protein